MNDIIYIVYKSIRFKVSISYGDLKVEISTRGVGYISTVHHKNINKYV